MLQNTVSEKLSIHFYSVWKNIANFILKKKYNSARLEWLTFNNSNHMKKDNITVYDLFGDEASNYFLQHQNSIQTFEWKAKCSNEKCNNLKWIKRTANAFFFQ